jgi:hypothetical protein
VPKNKKLNGFVILMGFPLKIVGKGGFAILVVEIH